MAILEQTMLEAKKILITTRSREVIVIRSRSKAEGFCAVCGTEVGLFTLDESTSIIGAGTRSILECLDEGRLHAIENQIGRLLVCSVSLRKYFEGL